MSVFARRDVWTFRLTGGEPIDAGVSWPHAVPTNLSHGGRGVTSLWTLLCTEQEAEATEEVLASKGVRVLRWCEVETEEQRRDRDRLRAAQAEGAVFRTPRCPSCFWLDVAAADEPQCGFVTWPRETVREALAAHERAVGDLGACPLGAALATEATPQE